MYRIHFKLLISMLTIDHFYHINSRHFHKFILLNKFEDDLYKLSMAN